MSIDDGLAAWLDEALSPVGTVSIRRMFGGAGAYLDGHIFAILADGELWIKSDSETDAIFDGEGCERFTYDFGAGKTGVMNYRRAPSEIYDDADALRRWAALGVAASARKAGA